MNTAKQLGGGEQGDEILTKQDLAARLKVTVRSVENWQQAGFLPYLKISNVIRFYWPDVLEHLKANFLVRDSGGARVRWGAHKANAETLKAESASRTCTLGKGGGR